MLQHYSNMLPINGPSLISMLGGRKHARVECTREIYWDI